MSTGVPHPLNDSQGASSSSGPAPTIPTRFAHNELATPDAKQNLEALEAQIRDPKAPWLDRVAAMETWIDARGVRPTAGAPMERAEFKKQAELLGLELTIMSASRFDDRRPEVISRTGFQPNPEEKPGSLLQHLEGRSCSLVSCALEGTAHIAEAMALKRTSLTRLEPDLVAKAAAIREAEGQRWKEASEVITSTNLRAATPETMRTFMAATRVADAIKKQIQEALGAGLLRPFQQNYELFEYKIVGVEGARTDQISGNPYPKQREITIREASPEQVVAYRQVRVSLQWVMDGKLELLPAPSRANVDEELLYSTTKVAFGTWQPLRAQN